MKESINGSRIDLFLYINHSITQQQYLPSFVEMKAITLLLLCFVATFVVLSPSPAKGVELDFGNFNQSSFSLSSLRILRQLANVTARNLSSVLTSGSDVNNTLALMQRAVACGLANGTEVNVNVSGHSIVLRGLLGLAANWTNSPLSVGEQQLITGCILATVIQQSNESSSSNASSSGSSSGSSSSSSSSNSSSSSVGNPSCLTISLLGVNASGSPLLTANQELTRFNVSEGAFFGNLFANSSAAFVCNDNFNSSAVQSNIRICALPPSGANSGSNSSSNSSSGSHSGLSGNLGISSGSSNNTSATTSNCPPIIFVGSCSSICTKASQGKSFSSCTWNGKSYLPITVFLSSEPVPSSC
jgi:hypothetical protein